MPYPELEKFKKEISQCALCAGCQENCPVYGETLDESGSARGKLGLMEGLLEGKLSLSPKFSEKMFQCLSCLNCSKICASGVDPARLINAARAEIVSQKKTGLVPRFILPRLFSSGQVFRFWIRWGDFFLKYFYHWVPSIKINGFDPSFLKDGKRRKIPGISGAYLKDGYPEQIKVDSPSMRVLFFTGCMGDMVYQKACSQVIDFLKSNRVEVILPKDQLCCGAPLYYSGAKKAAMDLARGNLEIFKRWNPDYVINNCATCGLMLKEVYTYLAPEEEVKPFIDKIMDVHSFIAQKTPLPQIAPGERKIKVTYHDPCHLGRGQGVRAEPRDLLKSIPWVDYVEMEGADLCCGGAGLFSVKYYDLALEIASKKVAAIKKTGAELVATGCPSCQTHISDALSRAGINIPVAHTTQLLFKKEKID